MDLWVCWFQGIEDEGLPFVEFSSLIAWKKFAIDNGLKFNLITADNVASFLPDYLDLVDSAVVPRAFAHKADLLRLMLLDRYGGIWVDASVYPMSITLQDIESWLNSPSEFFAFRREKRAISPRGCLRDISVWFLASKKPCNYIIQSWKNDFIKVFINEMDFRYHEFGNCFSSLMDSDSRFRGLYESTFKEYIGTAHSFGPWLKDKNLLQAQKSLKAQNLPYVVKRPRDIFVPVFEYIKLAGNCDDRASTVLKVYNKYKSDIKKVLRYTKQVSNLWRSGNLDLEIYCKHVYPQLQSYQYLKLIELVGGCKSL